ncbi:phage tail protein [Halomonas rhizosphaerae]|uniref:Phage tail protein n=1 Tax=Halomonas rhizosphaerae TaxID=3043296 RepID=A0ABT6V2J0_9GAMM|nr:phage tail protein [Halomonas rhizosphaerae]MDI5892151.1 phage tail protein [Halomonas rhizosphaerae]
MFVFAPQRRALPGAAAQESRSAWRHEGQCRVGKRPARQFLGTSDDPLTDRLLSHFTGGQQSLEQLSQMAAEGAAWPLIEGNGTFYGLYVIESLCEIKSHQMRDGGAQPIGFSLTLQRVDGDRADLLGSLTGALAWAATGSLA